MDSPAPIAARIAELGRKAMEFICKHHARRQVQDALRMRNSPKSGHMNDVPIGSKVFVWRRSGPDHGRMLMYVVAIWVCSPLVVVCSGMYKSAKCKIAGSIRLENKKANYPERLQGSRGLKREMRFNADICITVTNTMP